MLQRLEFTSEDARCNFHATYGRGGQLDEPQEPQFMRQRRQE